MSNPRWQWEPLDEQLAGYLTRQETKHVSILRETVKMLSHDVRQGHSCLSLPQIVNALPDESEVAADAGVWMNQLRHCQAVGEPGDTRPLILDAVGSLYFHRYWQYEHLLARALLQRAESVLNLPDPEWLDHQLSALYPAAEQKQAAENAIRHSVCLISGGPGTGKTTTIAGLLTVLLRWRDDLQIVLAAPTGKAAARMQEALQNAAKFMALPAEEAARLQVEAVTIHRLLGYQHGKVTFRHDADNPLAADVVIVDEASMIDLPLMSKLVDAVRDDARLVLLGDRDQLASVEVGAVLGDMAAANDANRLAANISVLTHSYRFDAHQGIGALARAVNGGNADETLRVLNDPAFGDVRWMDLQTQQDEWRQALFSHVAAQIEASRASKSPLETLQTLGRFQLLCAHRNGRLGVEGMTREVEAKLEAKGLVRHRQEWYEGRPILVTANDYQARLFNGDFGLTLRDAEGEVRICFAANDEDGVRCLSPARLPQHQTAWAITVHKSQGSEFDEVMLILPETVSPVLTRELIYTAVTRAKKRMTIIATESVLRKSVSQRVERSSGLLRELSVRKSD